MDSLVKPKRLPRSRGDIGRDWPLLTAYQPLETGVGLVLILVIAAVVLVALYRLVVGVFDTLVLQDLNPLEHGVFLAALSGLLLSLSVNLLAGARPGGSPSPSATRSHPLPD